MRTIESDQNIEKNKKHYDKLYANYPVGNILYWINNLDNFLETAITTETSWFALYQGNFRNRLRGSKVVEMGCGDCVNVGIMAALGAQVFANDISSESGKIVAKLNQACDFDYPITFIEGDFLKNELPENTFDFVIGKAFLHHLSLSLENEFLEETHRLLKKGGEARFFEPAVNSKFLDAMRWMIPIGERPSSLKRRAFKEWKRNDPHPDRTFSSRHFKITGEKYFKSVEIIPVGTLERFSRLFKWGEQKNRFRRWALENEKRLPLWLNKTFTRSQLIIYKNL